MTTELRNLSVLIVDDDPFSRDLLSDQLNSLGIDTVHTAPSGAAAVQVLAQLRMAPHLIISDVFMPDMDGIELMDQLAQRRYTGAVILLTGVDLELLAIARDLARANGIRLLGSFPKPLPGDKLAELLKLVTP
ncbi:MAG: hypothetical protein Fur007_04250 [Rhodoferax sp.]